MNEEVEISIPANLQKEISVEIPKKQPRMRKGILDNLPPETRKEIDAFIRANNPLAGWKLIQQKYVTQFPHLAKLSKNSVYIYAKKHSLKNSLRPEVKELILHTPPDAEVKDAIIKITDPNASLTDKRAALLKVYQDIRDGIERLKNTQVNYTDPQIEQVITNKEKVLIDIIKQMDLMTDKQAQESDKNWLQEALNLMQIFLSGAASSYKEIHTDQTLLSSFMDNYATRLENFMKNYRATKEEFFKTAVNKA
jgi:hypothetical protein